MNKRVANKRGQPSRNRMYARGATHAETRAKRKAEIQHRDLKAMNKEMAVLKNLLATPPKKVGFFRNLLSRRGG